MFTSKETFLRKPLQWGGACGGVLCCLVAQSVGTAASRLELAARRRQVFGIEEGSGRTAGIQSAIADQYGVLTESSRGVKDGGSGEVGAGGGGCAGQGGLNGSERNGTFYTPLLRSSSSSRQRKGILLSKGSLGNCCTSSLFPPHLLGNSAWFCGESSRPPPPQHFRGS